MGNTGKYRRKTRKKIHKKHENITTNTAQKLQNRFTSQGNVTFTEGSQVQPYNHVKKNQYLYMSKGHPLKLNICKYLQCTVPRVQATLWSLEDPWTKRNAMSSKPLTHASIE